MTHRTSPECGAGRMRGGGRRALLGLRRFRSAAGSTRNPCPCCGAWAAGESSSSSRRKRHERQEKVHKITGDVQQKETCLAPKVSRRNDACKSSRAEMHGKARMVRGLAYHPPLTPASLPLTPAFQVTGRLWGWWCNTCRMWHVGCPRRILFSIVVLVLCFS